MKKTILIAFVAVLFFVSACSKQEIICPDGSKVSDIEDCNLDEQLQDLEKMRDQAEQMAEQMKEHIQEGMEQASEMMKENKDSGADMENEQEEETEDDAVPAAKQYSEKVQELLGKYSKKIKSMKYDYGEVSNGQKLQTYYIKGNKMKIELFEPRTFTKGELFDTVYMDLEKKTAVGYCESRSDVKCPDPTKEFSVKYEDFEIMLPQDWLDDVSPDAVIGESKTLEDRNAVEIKYTRPDGTDVSLWVDEYFGMPLRAELSNGEVYMFTKLDFNGATDDDVVKK